MLRSPFTISSSKTNLPNKTEVCAKHTSVQQNKQAKNEKQQQPTGQHLPAVFVTIQTEVFDCYPYNFGGAAWLDGPSTVLRPSEATGVVGTVNCSINFCQFSWFSTS